MYALEIDFNEGASKSERLLLRRPYVTVGSGEHHHVMIEDLAELGYSLLISRREGRTFHVATRAKSDDVFIPAEIAGDYDGDASIDLGQVTLHVTALDLDLALRDEEPYDRAGIRILREAVSSRVTAYPAIFIAGEEENNATIVSFRNGQSVLLGRSSFCNLRFDYADISAKHARIGYESGAFWVEDLGSTNGTFVDGTQITGRVSIEDGQAIALGRDVVVYGVASSEQVEQLGDGTVGERQEFLPSTATYPVLYSLSEVARPVRYVLRVGYEVKIGRDPSSDIWLGVPHVSRKHCTVLLDEHGEVTITDYSKNGVSCNGVLLGRGQQKVVDEHDPCVLSFGASVNIALCFKEKDEKSFLVSDGDTFTFSPHQKQVDGIRYRSGSVMSMNGFHGFYRSLSFRRKLFLLLSVFLVLVVLLFFVKLLIPVFR